MATKQQTEKRIRDLLLAALSERFEITFIFTPYGESSHGIWVENDKGEKYHLFDSRDIYQTKAFLEMMLAYDYYSSQIERAKQGK